MVTITISGFKSKEEALNWLEAYEGGIEQNMTDATNDSTPSIVDIDSYIKEKKMFNKDKDKENFNLKLESVEKEE
jgi:hypothetical protein